MFEYRQNTDRPNLAYIYRDNASYIIDSGNSKKHVKSFYKALKKCKLPLPKYCIITHHHWDHTFGLNYTNAISIGLKETNDILNKHKDILKEKGIKELITQKEIPAFCIDHINLEYKYKSKKITLKLLDELLTSDREIDDLLLVKFPSNHTDENLVILDKKTGILFLGDALCGKIIDYDFITNDEITKEQIKYLNELEFTLAIESHANPITKEELLNKLTQKVK